MFETTNQLSYVSYIVHKFLAQLRYQVHVNTNTSYASQLLANKRSEAASMGTLLIERFVRC